MRAPAARLPLWVLPPAAASVAGLVIVFALYEGTDTISVYERGIAATAGIAGIALGLAARPAWPLSIGLGLTVFSGHWGDLGSPLPLDRLMLLTGIASTLIRERARSADALRLRPIDLMLGVVALYAITSTVVVDSLQIKQARFALLDGYALLGFTLFFVAPKAFREERDRQVLLGVLVAVGGYLGLTALFETTGPDALVFPEYIKDPLIGTHADRARGPFAEAGANGVSLFSCAVAATLALFMWRNPRARRIAGVVVVLCCLGILFSLTRIAWIASAAGAIAGLLAARETRPFVVPVLIGAALAIGGALAVVPGLADKATDRTNDEKPIWDRKNSNLAALRMIEDRPLLGFGWGTFSYVGAPYYRQSQDYPLSFVDNLHNVYLANAVTLGLVGFSLWMFGLVAALGGAVTRRGPPDLRIWKLSLVAIVVSVAVNMTSTPFGFALPILLMWTWAGIARGDSEGRSDDALGRAPVVERAEAPREPLIGVGVAR